jgi:hypothetical protein
VSREPSAVSREPKKQIIIDRLPLFSDYPTAGTEARPTEKNFFPETGNWKPETIQGCRLYEHPSNL